MIARCYNPRHPKYWRYGARGIKVCDRWRFSVHYFVADVGKRPSKGLSIGRKNNDGDYEPENVRWETSLQQMRNTGWNRMVTINGVAKTVSSWASENNLSCKTLTGRIESDWPENKLLTPVGVGSRKLSRYDIIAIRELRSSGLPLRTIAAKFGVCASTVANIESKRSWKRIRPI